MVTHFRPQQISLTDTQLIDLPRSQKASGIAMFAGNVHLPRDAARIPAARYGPDLSRPMSVSYTHLTLPTILRV